MSFNSQYIEQFERTATIACERWKKSIEDEVNLGEHIDCPYPPEAIMEVMQLWVNNVDKLLALAKETSPTSYSKKFIQLYAQRGITYEEYYYLFSENIDEENYLKTPAYVFTKTYSKDLRKRRFQDYAFSPESYKAFILSLDTVPSRFFLRRLQARLPVEALFAHSYCVAKTRSGKTELLKLIIYNLIKRKYPGTSMLILDPHGEFAREIRRLKLTKEQLDQVVYLDPTIDEHYTPVFNPFDVKEKGTAKLAYATDTILDAFQQLLREQSITGNMKRLLRHCIYALLYNDRTTMMDLLTILSAISRNRNKKEPEFFPDEERLMQFGKTAPDPLTRRFFEYGWKEVDSRTISAVVERIDGILSHPLVRRFVVGENSFDLEYLLNNGKIVIVNLDFTKLGNIGSEAIGRLIVSEAQNISAQRNRIPKPQRPRTLIFMDECQRFVSAAIERALSEFGKFNTYLFLAHQYIEQMDDGMSKAMLSNTENKIVGRNSAASMGSISADMGISKEDLMQVKKYQFYIKAGDRDSFLFQSSDFLLDKPGSSFYISEEEAKEHIDTYMIEKYYRPIGIADGSFTNLRIKAFEQGQKTTKVSGDEAIHLDDNDF